MNENHVISIIEAFSGSNIAEIELSEGNLRLHMRKESALGPSAPPIGEGVGREAPRRPDAQASESAGSPAEGRETVTSPLVGTFYASPGPDAPPFAPPGARVKAGDSLCILEAMKMMNRLEAEHDCEIVSVLASNGDLVEFGQALFEIKRV